MIDVRLEWYEIDLAANVGVRRRVESLRQGRDDLYNGNLDQGWQRDINGACGEMAVAKLLRFYYSGSVNTFKLPDIGRLQVRTCSKPNYGLIVRPKDSDDDVFVLVISQMPTYRVAGWMRGSDAKREEWLKAPCDSQAAYFVPEKHCTPAYFVPQKHLRNISELSELSKQKVAVAAA